MGGEGNGGLKPGRWPGDDGEMAGRIRAFDWSATPLGPIEGWPQSLKTVVELMLASREPVYVAWGPELTSLYNDGYVPILGPQHPDGLGKPHAELWPEIWDEFRPIVEATLAGEAQRFVDRPVALAGRPMSRFTFSWTPLRDEEGEISGFYCSATETTDRVRAERTLREGEERHRLVVEGARDYAIITTDTEGRIEGWSPGAEAVYGWTAEEAVGQKAAMTFTPEDRGSGEPEKELATALREGIAPDVRWHLRKDGSRVFIEGRTRALRRGDGGLRGFLKVGQDVTRRRESEEALRVSEERFRALVEGWAQAVWETNAEGAVVADSPSWRAYTGQTLAEWLGYGWLSALHPDDRPHAERQWREAVAARRKVDAEFRLRRAGGGWRWTNVRAAPLLAADGTVLKWVGMNIDIGARKRAEEVLRENEARQAFLLRLSDALRPLSDPTEIQSTATRLLGEHLGADRAYYYEIDADGRATSSPGYSADGVAMPQRLRVSDFGARWLEAYAEDRPLAVGDVETDERFSEPERQAWRAIGLSGGVGVPLNKDGRLSAVLGVNNMKPRSWTGEELRLLEEVAERTWAAVERARAEAALRKSEERLRLVGRAAQIGSFDFDAETGRGIWSRESLELFGLPEDRAFAEYGEWLDLLHPDDRERVDGEAQSAFAEESRAQLDLEFRIRRADTGEVRWIFSRSHFERDADGRPVRVLGAQFDITEHKRREANLQFLAEIAEDSSRLWAADEIMRTVGEKLSRFLDIRRCHVALIDEPEGECRFLDRWDDPSLPPLPPVIRLTDVTNGVLLEPLRRQETVSSNVVAYDPHMEEGHAKLDTAAYITVPFQQRGDWKYVFAVNSTTPRVWRDDEIELVEEIASRLFPRLERARVEETLRASEEKYRALFDSMDEAYAVVEVISDEAGTWSDFRFLEVNPAFVEHTGMEHPVGRTATELLGTPNPRWAEIYGQVAETGESVRAEVTESTLDRVFDLNIFRLGGPGSRRVAVLFTNITERKRAEAALRESEERYRLAADAAGLGRWRLAPETGEIVGDDTFAEHHGAPPGVNLDFEGHLEAIHPDDRDGVRRRVARALQEGEGYEGEYRVPLPGGSTRFILSRGRFVSDNGSAPGHLGGVTLDVTERRELEKARALTHARELTALAEAAERERISRELHDRVAHHMGVAHQSLELHAALAEDAPERAAEKLALARETTRRALDQTRALSAELKRLQEEELEGGLAVALGSLAEASVPDGVGFDFSFRGDESQIPKPIGLQVYLAMREAIRNAVRHSGCSRISVSLEVEDGGVRGRVEDDGEGFEPEAVDKATPSWGVGLRSMRERAEMFGGRLRLDSNPGSGTTMEIRVPLRRSGAHGQ